MATAADALLAGTGERETYDQAFREATGRLSTTVRGIASDPRFREAVAWQNRRLLTDCLDKAAAGEPRNARGRNHERAITSYFQRYTAKNDTIGFFGPVGWAAWTDSTDAMTVTPGPGLLAARNIYFESWAIDAVARALSGREQLRPWLSPHIDSAHRLVGPVVLRPGKDPLHLSAPETVLLGLCDGRRTVRELARHPQVAAHPALGTEAAVLNSLELLQKRGVIALGWEGPVEARPEDTLRAKLERIDDATHRNEALDVLGALCRARDAVAAAAGDARRLATALDDLNDMFVAATGTAAVRRHGQSYAGRTLVYEDTVRAAEVELGTPLREALAAPLALMLDSARWLVNRIADEYTALFTGIHGRWMARNGAPAMPLARMLAAATPHLFYSARALPSPVRTAVADLQSRWQRVLGLSDSFGAPVLTSDDLAERFRAEFPATPPAWAAAIHHSPDIMLAAANPEAIRAGDYVAVLGELHTALNTLESRVCVEQHPAPGRLRAADGRDHGSRRIYLVPPKDWPTVTSRLAPPSALLCPDYTYWTLRTPSAEPPVGALTLADLEVHQEDGRLRVRTRGGEPDGFECDLLEMFGELLSGVTVNSFKPFPVVSHRPRITIDNLVVAREAWAYPAAELTWVSEEQEADRFLAARAWRADERLPERVFYRTPNEDKPVLLDFGSVPLVNLFTRAVRKAVEVPDAAIGLAEMLPDVPESWLQDRSGAGYTAELRMVAVDPSVYQEGQGHSE
ncbi:lantibiotic dehydratase [Streptomyces sp. CoT10]|uniref:lantibiotic dehydratase n=1 Tax=Streptomyces sp. CoT10 TaxID=2875762 RepID=UPI001CD5154B|nr:lantibiotic dehydratase [Streptomyces sp. CoT10]